EPSKPAPMEPSHGWVLKPRWIENKTILSVAYQVGYQNKSTFNELFKKETGLTPTEWKKKGSNL
ncbi:MAG: AraC family transcriptional regulator, partial [Spirochaetia bacterium]|nr:AraC family transcriptional regulator [Spirochaetia bacterium]